ncbi:MAG: PEGA domain-containing protein [Candidatus Aminicenantaceae bacterium]
MPDVSEELKNEIRDIASSIDQKNYDDALNTINEALSKYPNSEELSSLKKRVQEDIKTIIEETKQSAQEGKYDIALKNISDYLLLNPGSFLALKKEKKSIEKKLNNEFSRAKKEYKEGHKDKALEILEQLARIPESDSETISSNMDSIKEMIEEIKAASTEKTETESIDPEPIQKKKGSTAKKWKTFHKKIEDEKYDEAKQTLEEIIELDPEDEEAKKYLNIMEMDSKNISNLFFQNRLDDALLAISVSLSKNPDNQETLSYKWRVESQVSQKINEINKMVEEKKYKDALYEIKDALKNNPRAFKKLEPLQKKVKALSEGKTPEEIEEEEKGKKTSPRTKKLIPLVAGIAGIVIIALALVLFLPKGNKKKEAITPGQILLTKQEGINYSDLSVTMGDISFSPENPVTHEIKPGTYNFNFQKGDHTYNKQVNIQSEQETKVMIPLIPVKIDIQPGGEIWENEDMISESNSLHEFHLLPDEYTFIIKKEGYQDETVNFSLEENNTTQTFSFELAPVPPDQPGILRVQVHPSGSQVYEESNLLASFPPLRQDISLSPGRHTLRYTNTEQNCEDREISYRINSGGIITDTIYLCFGTLNINTMPPGAAIIIDGKENDIYGNPYGTTPRANLRLPTGLHTLQVSHPDYSPKTVQFVIEANKRVNRSVDLRKEQ